MARRPRRSLALLTMSLTLAGCGGGGRPSEPAGLEPRPTLPRLLDEAGAEVLARTWLAADANLAPGEVDFSWTGIPDGLDRLWYANVVEPAGAVCVDLDTAAVMQDRICENRLIGARATPVVGVLAPADQALLDVLEPDEIADADVEVRAGLEEAIAATAPRLGMEVRGRTRLLVVVQGTADQLRRLAEVNGTRAIRVSERVEIDRPLAPPGLAGELPTPGRAYDSLPAPGVEVLTDDGSIKRAIRDSIIAELAVRIVSLEARPYDSAQIRFSCDPAIVGRPNACIVSFSGSYRWSDEATDLTWYRASADRGWLPEPIAAPAPTHNAVPRRLGREAERIARTNSDAAAAIADYTNFGGFAWHPERPNVIGVRYWRYTQTASLAGVRAQVGLPTDWLVIEVDLSIGRVAAIRAGSAGVAAQP